jgi:hypothetical protein
MENLTKDVLVLYGPLAIGWIVAFILGWRLWFDTTRVLATQKEYAALVDQCHVAIVYNTKVTERLAVLIEERTRIQQRANGQ